jgi:mannose-6-phosphate isomerase-like protein (cupin superfamily)
MTSEGLLAETTARPRRTAPGAFLGVVAGQRGYPQMHVTVDENSSVRTSMQAIKQDNLPSIEIDGEIAARVFDGEQYGATVSAIIVDVAEGGAVPHHRHPYEEVFVIVEGSVRVQVEDDTLDATSADICVIPAAAAHAFTNIGSGRARMVNINAAPRVITEFIAEEPPDANYTYDQPAVKKGDAE